MAAVDGLSRLNRTLGWAGRRWAAVAVPLGLVVTLALAPTQPLRDLARPAFWDGAVAAQRTRAVLEVIPAGATVAATNVLAPQLTARCTVYLFPSFPTDQLRPQWIATLERPDSSLVPVAAITDGTDRLPALGYRVVTRRDGVVLWRLDPQLRWLDPQ